MNNRFNILLLLFLSVLSCFRVSGEDWTEKRKYLVYSPRYFGPNAFPFPELVGGKLSDKWEIELRGDYHKMTGDKTKDLFARLYVPIAGGKAGLCISGVLQECYKTSEAVRDERHAVEVSSPIPCFGDVVLNCYYQLLRSEKWADIVISANIKTASGGRLCDARFTDAASYWFDANIGRDLWHNEARDASVRMDFLAGFYCWMTNDMMHRQNDAVCYGGGLCASWKGLLAKCDLVGFKGYLHNGDTPLLFRSKLEYDIKNNVVSFRYKTGLHDYLYDSYSLAYIRRF